MFSDARLGQSDVAWYDLKDRFLGYWNSLKSNLSAITNLDQVILKQASRLQVAKSKATTNEQIATIQQAIDRNVGYYNMWVDIVNNIKSYLPEWLQAEKAAYAGPPAEVNVELPTEQQITITPTTTGDTSTTTTTTTTGMQGLGLIPLLIGIAALAALAYVAVKGMELLKQVMSENRVVSDLEKGLLTTSQVKSLLPTGLTPIAEPLVSFGSGFTLLIPIAVVGLLYFLISRK